MENSNKLVYESSILKIIGISCYNLLLNIPTFGIYSFWGRTNLRKYFASSFSLLGYKFEYIGTGKELLLGFLKALGIYFAAILMLTILMIIFNSTNLSSPLIPFLLSIVLYAAIIFLFFIARYLALRYRYSRLTWLGIRFRLTGSVFQYTWLVISRFFINIISLGFLAHHSDIKINKYIIENSYFGSEKASFNPDPSKLTQVNAFSIAIVILSCFSLLPFIVIPCYVISRSWYKAALMRHVYESTTINSLKFQGLQTGGNYLLLTFKILLLFILPIIIFVVLGVSSLSMSHFSGIEMSQLQSPDFILSSLTLYLGGIVFFIVVYSCIGNLVYHLYMNYFAKTLVIIGEINTDHIAQSPEELSNSGEGLQSLLNNDMAL